MSLVLVFGLWACTAKTEVTLTSVDFKSFYLGSDLNPPENEQIKLTIQEGKLVETFVDKLNWVTVSPDKNALEPIGVLLYDTKGLRYELYQALDQLVIKVTETKKSAVYFTVTGDNNTLIQGQLKPLKKAIEAKKILLKSDLLSANADLWMSSSQTRFDLTTGQSDQLKTLLKFEEWNAIVTVPTDSTPDAEMLIGLTNGHILMFHDLGTSASVTLLQLIDGKTELSTYQITKSTYDAVKTQLKQWGIEAHPVVKPDLEKIIFTEVKFELTDVPTHVLKSVFFPITEAESNQAKTALGIPEWVRLFTNTAIQSVFMTLKDTEGYVYTIGYANNGYAVQITHPLEPLYIMSYLIPSTPVQISFAFMPLWEDARATQAMLDFVPTQLSIDSFSGDDWNYRDINLSTSQAKDLISLLKLSTWAVDPDPSKYAFGWLPKYILKDNKGNSFSIYSYYTQDIMAVVVRDASTPPDEWVWYFTSNSVFTELATYISDHYPAP